MSETAAPALSAEHRDFFERFQSFWAAPSGARVAEIISPDARIHFTGAGSFSGAEYVDAMQAVIDANPEMSVRAIDCAGQGNLLYIFWETTNVFNGQKRSFVGVDRFRIVDGMAVEEHVIFDSAANQAEAAMWMSLEGTKS
jgi:predicted SnoaL-like aldol condensation-catalyzing enzyme